MAARPQGHPRSLDAVNFTELPSAQSHGGRRGFILARRQLLPWHMLWHDATGLAPQVFDAFLTQTFAQSLQL